MHIKYLQTMEIDHLQQLIVILIKKYILKKSESIKQSSSLQFHKNIKIKKGYAIADQKINNMHITNLIY